MKKIDSALIIDDSPAFINLVKKYLQKFNLCDTFFEATNGKDALSYFKKDKLPSVVFLDINMPIMNGFDVLETLSSENKDYSSSHIVMMSSSVYKEDIKRSKTFPNVSYFTKPINIQKIEEIWKKL